MRILVLGGDGMLGHQLFKTLLKNHDVCVTLRQTLSAYKNYGLFENDNAFDRVDARNQDVLQDVFNRFHPDVVVNAIGIVKQRKSAKDSIPSIEINALLPHRLAVLCETINAKMIHLSTDCVFSGM